MCHSTDNIFASSKRANTQAFAFAEATETSASASAECAITHCGSWLTCCGVPFGRDKAIWVWWQAGRQAGPGEPAEFVVVGGVLFFFFFGVGKWITVVSVKEGLV